MDPARLAALDLFRAVELDGAYANIAWPRILTHHRLSGRDAGFATELGYGALRWRGRHDAILADCVDRPLDTLQPELLNALRLGVHQLHNMRVSDHAAVGETVELARQTVNQGAAGFANAVLRRVARGGSAEDWLDHLVVSGALPSLSPIRSRTWRSPRRTRPGSWAASTMRCQPRSRSARGTTPPSSCPAGQHLGRGDPGDPHDGPPGADGQVGRSGRVRPSW